MHLPCFSLLDAYLIAYSYFYWTNGEYTFGTGLVIVLSNKGRRTEFAMRSVLIQLVMIVMCHFGTAAYAVDIPIVYLERVVPTPPTLSNLDPVPDDLALAGAALGVSDISTTGKFLGHSYSLDVRLVEDGEDIAVAAAEALSISPFLIVNAAPKDVLTIADLSEAQSALIFNVSATDAVLRNKECRRNVLHTIPSRAMLADALAQFAVKKRWTTWAMIVGPREGDAKLAQALETSATKFGVKFRNIKGWTFDADLRRSAAQEVPLFTQEFDDHDMLIVTDEINDFARYIQYNTWLPRPLAGSWGVTPTAWSASVEQHGAAQLQSRFVEQSGRAMRSEDYAAMLAVSAIGEAVTRQNTDDPARLRTYMLSDAFELGGFKGRPLSFRDWNGQLRQPIPLTHPGAVVALAPLEGYLHQHNELDTLGLDRPNSSCNAFSE